MWQGGLNGAFLGAATGALGGYLQHNSFENSLFDIDRMSAQTGGEIAYTLQLEGVVVHGVRTTGPLGAAAATGWGIGNWIGNNIETVSRSIASLLINLGVPKAILIDPIFSKENGKVYMAQHGKNNGKLTQNELDVLRKKQENGTLSNLEKQKLKRHDKNTGDRPSRQSKDKKR